MDNALFEHAAEARAALRSITSDQVGEAATLSERTAFPPEACRWVTAEIAFALGLAAPADTTRPGQVLSASGGSPASEVTPGPRHAPETLLATALTTQPVQAPQSGRGTAPQVSLRLAVAGVAVLLAAAAAGGYLLGRSDRHVITRTATRIEYRTRIKTVRIARGVPCFTLSGTLSGLGQPTGAIGGDGPINRTTCHIIVGGNGSAQGSYFYAQAADGSILNLEIAPQGQ
jgi:hypothetical protein